MPKNQHQNTLSKIQWIGVNTEILISVIIWKKFTEIHQKIRTMKNLFLLPTEKPSVLGLHFDIIKEGRLDYAPNFCFTEFNRKRNFQHNPHHIYITNSEEIKVNDYITDGYKVWQWKDDSSLLGRKKVILTTDQALINDGVQAIDDELEAHRVYQKELQQHLKSK